MQQLPNPRLPTPRSSEYRPKAGARVRIGRGRHYGAMVWAQDQRRPGANGVVLVAIAIGILVMAPDLRVLW